MKPFGVADEGVTVSIVKTSNRVVVDRPKSSNRYECFPDRIEHSE